MKTTRLLCATLTVYDTKSYRFMIKPFYYFLYKLNTFSPDLFLYCDNSDFTMITTGGAKGRID